MICHGIRGRRRGAGPAGANEILDEYTAQRLQIDTQRRIHSDSCDIKNPRENFTKMIPQGGDGLIDPNMCESVERQAVRSNRLHYSVGSIAS